MKKDTAYACLTEDGVNFIVAACKRGEEGYHPVPDYGPYTDESQANGVVARLNKRLGLTGTEARLIALSTMPNRRGAAT